MTDFQTIANDLVDGLQLQYQPAGIQIYRETDPLPDDISLTERELKSYCQAVILAGEGETLLLEKEKMGCKLGTSVLGFEKDMEAYLDDGVLEKYGVGLFETEEASAETILKSTYLEKGQTRAALIAPLPAFDEIPQVVVFTANSEQIMWLLYAVNYEKGGRMDLPQSGGALGGCADMLDLIEIGSVHWSRLVRPIMAGCSEAAIWRSPLILARVWSAIKASLLSTEVDWQMLRCHISVSRSSCRLMCGWQSHATKPVQMDMRDGGGEQVACSCNT